MLLTYSFDIFDTCLVRKCGSSDNIFCIWADRALGKVDRSYLKDLINSRLNAEKTARRNSGKEDVSLDDIYRNLSLESFPNLSKPALKRLELEVERENLSPVRQALDLIRNYRKKGKRILFISDMYLPSDFLKSQLRRFGFWEEEDRIYVSGEIGLTKHSGNLFRYIQREERILRCSWIHVGDNTYSDYYVPKSMFIRSRRIYHPYTSFENLWQNDMWSPYKKFLPSYLSGLARAYRLSLPASDRLAFFVDVLLVPYFLFVYKVLRDAKDRGVDNLFFLARDSFVWYRMALRLRHLFLGMNFHYLYISRKAVFVSCLYDLSDYELELVFSDTIGYTPRQLLSSLALEEDEMLQAFCADELDEPLDSGKRVRFYDRIRSSSLAKILLEKSGEARRLLLSYLRQEGFLGSEKPGIVDIGWKGNTNRVLNYILRREEDTNAYLSFFLGVKETRHPIASIGDYEAGYYFEDYLDEPEYAYNLFALVYVLENYFSASDDTTLSRYREEDGTIYPEFSPGIISDASKEKNQYILRLTEGFLDIIMESGLLRYDPSSLFGDVGVPTLLRLASRPSMAELRVLRELTFNDIYVGDRKVVLKMYPWTICDYVLKKLKNRKNDKYIFTWFDASIIYTYGFLSGPILKLKKNILSDSLIHLLIKKVISLWK